MKASRYKITVENIYGEKLIMTVDLQTDIWGFGDVFRTILTWLTFGSGSIDRLIRREEDE